MVSRIACQLPLKFVSLLTQLIPICLEIVKRTLQAEKDYVIEEDAAMGKTTDTNNNNNNNNESGDTNNNNNNNTKNNNEASGDMNLLFNP